MIGVNFVISATTTGLQKAVAGAKMGFTSMRKSVNSAAGALTGFLGVGLGSAGLLKLSSDALTLAKSLDDTAKKLQVSRELLQELGFAGEQFGVGQDTVNMAMQRFIRRLGEAQQGTGELLPSLEQYNIALRDANGTARDAEDVLKDYADAMKGAETPQERLRLAFKAFDSEGAALVTVLQNGSEGLDEWAQKARDAGAVMNEDVVKDLAKASQEIENFRKRITVAMGNIIVNFKSTEGLKLLGAKLMRVGAAFGGTILDAMTEARDMIGAVVTGTFKGSLNLFRDGLIDIAQEVGDLMNKILPERFEINTESLDALRSTGEGIAASINRAIATTTPSTFKAEMTASWDEVIAKQEASMKATAVTVAETTKKAATEVNTQNEASTGKAYDEARRKIVAASDEMRKAGADAGGSVTDGGNNAGQSIEEGGDNAAKKLMAAGQAFSAMLGRSFEAIQDASDEALQELIRREREAITGFKGDPSAGSLARALGISKSKTTIARAEEELAFRQNLRRNVGAFGVEGARRFSSVDPLAFDKVVSEIVTGRDTSEKSLDELKTQTRLLQGKFRAQ